MAEDSISNSSEFCESSTIFCEPCFEDEKYVPANGYCVDCSEYLCDYCFTHHRVPRACRNHVLQDATKMPKRGNKHGSSGLNIKCPMHPDKTVCSYSKLKDQFYCQICVSVLTSHGMSNEFESLDQVARDIQNNEEFKAYDKKLHAVYKGYEENKEKAKMQLKMIDKNYDEAKDTFIRKLDEIKARDVSKMTNVIGKCDTAMKQLDKWISDKKTFQEDNRQLFELMKLTQKQLDMTGESVEPLARDNIVMAYEYRNVEDNDDNSIGKLVRIPTGTVVKNINLKHSTDTRTCGLRDIALLDSDLMLVSDCTNSSIKLINTSSNTVLSHTKLNSGPWEMTVTDNNQVYVAQPNHKKLSHLTTPTVDVSNIREIPVDGACWTVKYHDQKLKLQYFNPCKQVETDLNRRVLRTIHNDISTAKTDKGKTFVTNPVHSVLDKTTGSMIVSCNDNNSITEVTNDGKVKLLVKSAKLQQPHGLVMDMDGSILVCSFGGKRVFRVTDNGDIQDILPKPLEFHPYSLALDTITRRLYVGGSHDSVLVYQM